MEINRASVVNTASSGLMCKNMNFRKVVFEWRKKTGLKQVSNRFEGLFVRYYVTHAQQKNIQKLSEPTSSIND